MHPSLVLQSLEGYAKCIPHDPAIFYNNNYITYAELYERVTHYSMRISSIDNVQRVAIHYNRNIDLVCIILACINIGCTYIPLDPKHPNKRKQKIVEDCQPDLLLSDSDVSFFEGKVCKITDLQSTPIKNQHSPISYILYTSGSTGVPKGIEIKLSSVNALLHWANEYYTVEQCKLLLASTTITFDLSVFELLLPLVKGTSICLVDSLLSLIDEDFNFDQVTLINTVPSAMREIVRMNCLPKHLNTVNLAGEALTWDLVNVIHKQAPTINVYNLWGPSEDTTYSTAYHCNVDIQQHGAVPIGKPIHGTLAHILSKDGHFTSIGKSGEILLQGEGLANGYINNEELTSKQFVEINGVRTYKTGDLGFIDTNGDLHYQGRIDTQVKLRGFRIELEDIESHIYSVDGTQESVVAVHDDKLYAWVKHVSADIDESVYYEHLTKQLPQYMVPHHIVMMSSPLPRTTSGKLCRKSLVQSIQHTKTTYEDQLNEILARILKTGAIDFSKSFAQNGGSSLQCVQFYSELKTNWVCDFKLKDILEGKHPLSVIRNQLRNRISRQAPQIITISRQEHRMWKAIQTMHFQSAYNVSVNFRIAGELDEPHFINCINNVFGRHFNYRYLLNGHVLTKERSLSQFKLLQLDENKTSDEITRLINQQLDLNSGPLAQAWLYPEDTNTNNLVISISHAAIDGLSLNCLMSEVTDEYHQNKVITDSSSGGLDYYEDQESAEDFWETKLAADIQHLELDKTSDLHNTIMISNTFDGRLVDKINKVALENQVSLASLFKAVFRVALSKLGYGDNLLISMPVANRTIGDVSIVNKSNTLPTLVRTSHQETFASLINKQFQEFSEVLEFSNENLDSLNLSTLAHEKASRAFDIIFSWMDFGTNTLQLANTQITKTYLFQQKAKAPIVFSLIKNEDSSLCCVLEVNGDYYDTYMASALLNVFGTLLRALPGQLHEVISDIPIVEKHDLSILKKIMTVESKTYSELNTAILNYLHNGNSDVALYYKNEEMTYTELLNAVNNKRSELRQYGIQAGEGIGIQMERSKEIIITILAILLEGAYYVPLDKRNPKTRTEFIIQDSGLSYVVTDDSILKILNVSSPHPNRAYVIYTSGTTGKPKGVPVNRNSVMSLFDACDQWGEFTKDDKWLWYHSHAFDFSVWEIFGALLHGASIVIADNSAVGNPVELEHLINTHKITVLSQTPTSFRNLLNIGKGLTHCPRYIVFGGEALHINDVTVWYELYPDSQTQLINMYGITEVTVHATVSLINPSVEFITIGAPLANTGIAVVTTDGNLCPINTIGELWVCGHAITEGYLNRSELNSSKFVTKTFIDGNAQRFYRSGDLGRVLADGRIVYEGRMDSQIQLNGYRIEKQEIELATLKTGEFKQIYLKIFDQDSAMQTLVCYYVSDSTIDQDALKQKMQELLPSYAVPHYFVPINQLPLTINGKIDESQLEMPIERINSNSTETNDVLSIVKNIWQTLLNITEVSDTIPFFQQGGNSMKAMILVGKIKATFTGCDFSIVDVFKCPTIEQQSNLINQRIALGE